MSTSDTPRPSAPVPANRHRLIRRLLCSHNPCYAISAALVFWGLRSSFDVHAGQLHVGLLFGCLAAYTLLLAGTACLLLRLGGSLWEDIRTLALLVLLLLFALSVLLDDVLVTWPDLGIWINSAGGGLAVLIGELLFRGLRVRLGAWWRIPYHAIIALFFLYPVALSEWLVLPNSSRLQWGLFLFIPCVAAILLALSPAVRRGADYVRDNGTPWGWPLFPWSIFVVLVGCAGLRAWYLCLSLHSVDGTGSIFDLYFLAPLPLALGMLTLERGLAGRSPAIQRAACVFPALAVALAGTRAFGGPIHDQFLELFQESVDVTPFVAALCGAVMFCLWGAVRGARGALPGMAAALVGLAFVRPETEGFDGVVRIEHDWLLACAAITLIVWAALRGHSTRWALACVLFVAAATAIAWETRLTDYLALPAHLLLACGLAIAARYKDDTAALIRFACGLFLMAAALVAVTEVPRLLPAIPYPTLVGYVLSTITLAWIYGRWTRRQLFASVVVFNAFVLCLAAGGEGRDWLRPRMAGIDFLAAGLAFFVAAAMVSLWKAGRLGEFTQRALRLIGKHLDFSRPMPGA